MSIPKDKLHELVNELDDNEAEKVLDFVESLKKKQGKVKTAQFIGMYKDLDFDVDKESEKLRELAISL